MNEKIIILNNDIKLNGMTHKNVNKAFPTNQIIKTISVAARYKPTH